MDRQKFLNDFLGRTPIRVIALGFLCCTLGVADRAAAQDPLILTPLIPETPDFTRYQHPAECAASGRWQERKFWRDKRPDTIIVARHGNARQRIAVETARRCVARFDPNQVSQQDLLGLGEAYLVAEQYAEADAAFARLAKLVENAPAADRGWVLHHIVDLYLGAAPPRLAQAQQYVKQLDALAPAAPVERMLAHTSVARLAHVQDTVPLWQSELTTALAASRQMTGDLQKDYAPEASGVYGEWSTFHARQNDVAAAHAVIAEGERTLVPIRRSMAGAFKAMALWLPMQGKAAPRLVASQWSPLTPGDTIHPTTGRLALYGFASPLCGSMCAEGYAVIRRLASAYGNGLDMTLMTSTGGYYQDRLVKPDSELFLTRNHFTNWQHLPTNIAMWQTPLGKRDDGHVTVLSYPNGANYPLPPSMDWIVFLVDKNGVVRLLTALTPGNESLLRDVLDEAQQAPVAPSLTNPNTPASPPAPPTPKA